MSSARTPTASNPLGSPVPIPPAPTPTASKSLGSPVSMTSDQPEWNAMLQDSANLFPPIPGTPADVFMNTGGCKYAPGGKIVHEPKIELSAFGEGKRPVLDNRSYFVATNSVKIGGKVQVGNFVEGAAAAPVFNDSTTHARSLKGDLTITREVKTISGEPPKDWKSPF